MEDWTQCRVKNNYCPHGSMTIPYFCHLFRSYTNQQASKDKQGEGFFSLELHSVTTFDRVIHTEYVV